MSGEALCVYNPSNDKETILYVLRQQKLHEGYGSEPKSMVTVAVGNPEGRKIRTIRKTPIQGYMQSSITKEQYFQKWSEILVPNDIPTLPWVRLIKDSHDVLIPDLTADGSKLYGWHTWASYDYQEHTPVDDFFLQIPFKVLEREAEKLVDIANSKRILLPEDIMTLRVTPNARWYFMVLDIGWTITEDDPQNQYHSSAILSNSQGLSVFLRGESSLKDGILRINGNEEWRKTFVGPKPIVEQATVIKWL